MAIAGATGAHLGLLAKLNLIDVDEDEQITLRQVIADAARTKLTREAMDRHEAYYHDVLNGNPATTRGASPLSTANSFEGEYRNGSPDIS